MTPTSQGPCSPSPNPAEPLTARPPGSCSERTKHRRARVELPQWARRVNDAARLATATTLAVAALSPACSSSSASEGDPGLSATDGGVLDASATDASATDASATDASAMEMATNTPIPPPPPVAPPSSEPQTEPVAEDRPSPSVPHESQPFGSVGGLCNSDADCPAQSPTVNASSCHQAACEEESRCYAVYNGCDGAPRQTLACLCNGTLGTSQIDCGFRRDRHHKWDLRLPTQLETALQGTTCNASLSAAPRLYNLTFEGSSLAQYNGRSITVELSGSVAQRTAATVQAGRFHTTVGRVLEPDSVSADAPSAAADAAQELSYRVYLTTENTGECEGQFRTLAELSPETESIRIQFPAPNSNLLDPCQ